ncbi:META domain-containing protein [Rhodovibrionaceae bacterium A322]
MLPAALALLLAACQTTGQPDGYAVPDPSSLYGKTWVAESIFGKPVVDASRSSIEFQPDGKVNGRGGCNSYFGTYEIDQGILSFGPLGATRMACAPALDDQEMRFFDALSRGLDIKTKNGGLYLFAEGESAPVVLFPQN